jgi:SET domain
LEAQFPDLAGELRVWDSETYIPPDLVQAVAYVRSRALMMTPSTGLGNGVAILAPFLELANHSSTPNCVFYQDEEFVGLRPIRDLQPGEEITVSYARWVAPPLWRHCQAFEPGQWVKQRCRLCACIADSATSSLPILLNQSYPYAACCTACCAIVLTHNDVHCNIKGAEHEIPLLIGWPVSEAVQKNRWSGWVKSKVGLIVFYNGFPVVRMVRQCPRSFPVAFTALRTLHRYPNCALVLKNHVLYRH